MSPWPKRKPFEHVTDTTTVFERSLFVPDTYRPGEPSRLRVKHDEEHGLTWLADERVSSEATTAQVLDDEVGIDLTGDMVRWLYVQLGDLIDRWEGDAEPDPVRECKLCTKPFDASLIEKTWPKQRTWCDECRALPQAEISKLLRARKKRYAEKAKSDDGG